MIITDTCPTCRGSKVQLKEVNKEWVSGECESCDGKGKKEMDGLMYFKTWVEATGGNTKVGKLLKVNESSVRRWLNGTCELPYVYLLHAQQCDELAKAKCENRQLKRQIEKMKIDI